MQNRFRVGDPVVCFVSKFGLQPGRRAQHVYAVPSGDGYSYEVPKYWTVAEIQSPEKVRVITRRGKFHDLAISDPRLRPARWWEKLIFRKRFPMIHQGDEPKRHEN
ncbi:MULTISPECIES: hypothetical protein [unclassified Schlesneria]|uniref:hypothetical protein n=1 Tax=unclassified Schlesneria TaxID=2762017 RepID=UPI002F0E4330